MFERNPEKRLELVGTAAGADVVGSGKRGKLRKDG